MASTTEEETKERVIPVYDASLQEYLKQHDVHPRNFYTLMTGFYTHLNYIQTNVTSESIEEVIERYKDSEYNDGGTILTIEAGDRVQPVIIWINLSSEQIKRAARLKMLL